MTHSRRDFLRQLAQASLASSALSAIPASIARALEIPAKRNNGSIQDVKHVVIFMQENRSFDHYFGCLRGVRGFGDPRPLQLRHGKPVWYQPALNGQLQTPFALKGNGQPETDRSQCQPADLPHNWKYSQKMWAHYDVWVKEKTSMSMGYLTRAELPFYYALADAFTIGDAYFASVFGPTNPNRMFLFSGTNGVSVGRDGRHALTNVDDGNETSSMLRDKADWQSPYLWTTYAERLTAHGISWKVYQEYDNFGDNSLAYFPQFRGLDRSQPQQEQRYQAARAYAGETQELDSRGLPLNRNSADAQALVDAFAADVRTGRLPAVSWIVAPTKFSEHPEKNPPGYGESLTARLLDVLTENPEVWAQTVFILCYDEEGGLFDHVPPPCAPASLHDGYSSVSCYGEISQGEAFGLGARLPFIIASPWSTGGFVCSEVFDHTSIIRFLEQRFGVHEPNISRWRRTVCGDLTAMFDFSQHQALRPQQLFDTSPQQLRQAADLSCQTKKSNEVPQLQSLPMQEFSATGNTRPARALAYQIDLNASLDLSRDRLQLDFCNNGKLGFACTVYPQHHNGGPWYYTLASQQKHSGFWPLTDFANKQYALRIHGANAYYRQFQGQAKTSIAIHVICHTDHLQIQLHNPLDQPCQILLRDMFYGAPGQQIELAAGSHYQLDWSCANSGNWYDFAFTLAHDKSFLWRYAGHLENGLTSISDPALGKLAVTS